MKPNWKTLIGMGAALGLTALAPAAKAQWSIGPVAGRVAPAGQNAYVFLVFANPLAGREASFNEMYQNTHMGDLVQLQGFVGAQRFRLYPDVQPRSKPQAYKHGYVILWDEAGATTPARNVVSGAIAGGKSRKIDGFDYTTPGANRSMTYKVAGPRVTRPDGRKAFMPAADDNKTPRPNRYIMLDLASPAPGVTEADYRAALDKEIHQVLTLPGWMAAQPLVLEPTLGPDLKPATGPKFMVLWEVEGSAQAAAAALDQAVKAGQVQMAKGDPAIEEHTFWEPITPHITREDFAR